MNQLSVLKNRTKKNHSAGFTLVEIMIVIALMGFVMTFAARNISARWQEGKQKGSRILMREIQTALDDYYRACNSYPTTAQGGLRALIEKPTVAPECPNYDLNGYLKEKKPPVDGWGNEFFYLNEDGTAKYTLKSFGADKKEGGEGYDKDLDVNDPVQ
jgi:general secretion pathway protein G